MKKLHLFLFMYPFLMFAQDGIKPIIDVHLHGYSERTYRPLPGAPESYEAFKSEMEATFKKFNIVYAVKSGGTYDDNLEAIMLQGYESNNYPKMDTLEFKKQIDEDKIQVWGEFLPMFNGLTITDPGFAPYLKICEREEVPIALHTGRGPPNIYKRYTKFRLQLGDPLLIDEVLIKYPKLKIYLMHAGIPFHENTLAVMDQYPQVYCDLGAVLWVDQGATPIYVKEFLKKAKAYGFIDRIMYGSDAMYWPHHIEKSIQRLNSFEFLDEDDKRKIFYENAVEFFGLEHLNER
ncbi:amidohydrolase family protein [Aestuariivivens sediminicola]|uniref:amidohydrolase family protein n=1 Tax=Aestuariivivens sediminicola TaxID=2913560 RepID=UPI001F589346|nr:amidohydrolase family protein [Aestuariivivens sediminicola]